MRYTVSIDINAPLEEVVARFDNPENMKEWMNGLVSFETIEGEPGQVGSKARLKFQVGKRSFDMIETITVRDLPARFDGYYEVKGVYNEVGNSFEAIDEHTTRYTSNQFFDFKGGMKIIGWLFPKMFKKQSMKYLEDFKAFVERDYKA
ncbi:MAG TPA: SRPBCC family protein [Fluviicola sp.]|nr:SRPBCC family protein [Fluviicola sp.]